METYREFVFPEKYFYSDSFTEKIYHFILFVSYVDHRHVSLCKGAIEKLNAGRKPFLSKI